MISLLMEYLIIESSVSATMAHFEVSSIILFNVFFLSGRVTSFLFSFHVNGPLLCTLSQDTLFVTLLSFILLSLSWILCPFA